MKWRKRAGFAPGNYVSACGEWTITKCYSAYYERYFRRLRNADGETWDAWRLDHAQQIAEACERDRRSEARE